MANTQWRAIVGSIIHAHTKITAAQTIAAITAVSALGAAIFFWLATLDGVPAVGYYRLGMTMAVAGALLVWVTRLHARCREQAAKLARVEADLAAIKEDAHVRKVIKQMRRQGATANDVHTDN